MSSDQSSLDGEVSGSEECLQDDHCLISEVLHISRVFTSRLRQPLLLAQ